MGMLKLEKCCFIFELKTGNIILGCFNSVLSFTMTVIMIVTAAALGTTSEEDIKEIPMTASEKELLRAEMNTIYVICIILVVIFLSKFIFDAVFVYGVVNERAVIIKSYFIKWTVFFLLSVIIFFFNITKFSVGTICYELFYIGVNVYVIVLSHSYYQQLISRENV